MTKRSGGAGSSKRQPGKKTSVLSGHDQVGRVFKPPMRQIEALTTTWWLRDMFPDFLWICSLLTDDWEAGWHAGVPFLQLICSATHEFLPAEEGKQIPVLEGRLSSFEFVPVEVRESVLEQDEDLYFKVVSEDFFHALAMYPEAPSRWLLEPWRRRGVTVDWERAQRFLQRLIVEAAQGNGLLATRAKMFAIFGYVMERRIVIRKDPIMDMFPRWPDKLTDTERAMVECSGRAMYMAMAAHRDALPQGEVAAHWCSYFWRSNWGKFPCLARSREGETTQIHKDMKQLVDSFGKQLGELWARFEDTAVTTDPDIYSPDRHEVLTGLTSRALRLALVYVSAPPLWSTEHGSTVARSLVESLIVMKWLLLTERERPDIYTRFKDYGRGKLKLLLVHWRNHTASVPREEAERFGGLLKSLEAEVNEDLSEDYQDIDVSATFSGTDLRKMAQDVKMERDYRLVFAPASGVAHGEWWTMSRFSLERCRNPLHLGHRIPRRDIEPATDPTAPAGVIAYAEKLVAEYEMAVGRGMAAGLEEAAGSPETHDA